MIKIFQLLLFIVMMLLISTGTAELQPYNMPEGVTDISHEVFNLHMLIYWLCVAIGIVVYGVMVVSIIKHRKSKGHQAAQFHDSTTVEIIWTVIPLIILIGIAIPSTKTLVKMENTSTADMTVKITGYQWLWEYEYLDDNIAFYSKLSTSRDEIYNKKEKGKNYLLEVNNELVLPIDKKIRFLITSNDVLHAWWMPALAVKRDAIPGFINEAWAIINEPGVYRGQCAELCGRDHAFMPIVVRALPQNEYDLWVTEMQQKQSVATTQ